MTALQTIVDPPAHARLAAVPPTTRPRRRGRPRRRVGCIQTYVELTKARLSSLVLLTTAVGYALASANTMDWMRLLWTVLGTAMAACAAGALNQVLEARRDGLMRRTSRRPLPAGSITPAHALIVGVALAAGGLAILALLINTLAATLALATLLIYLGIYTPLKTRSTFNTLVGAVCGAIPPMIGWSAAEGALGAGAWILATILFLWQLPHFLALAWLHREDYERGGFRMLPVIDRSGRLTARVALLSAVALVPICLMLSFVHVTGRFYALGALALGVALIIPAARLHADLSLPSARRLFLASLLFLSLLMPLMVLDRGADHRHGVATMFRPSMALAAPMTSSASAAGAGHGGERPAY